MSVEQRKHTRFNVEVAAEVDMETEVLVASTMNISDGGVGVLVDRPLEEGRAFRLTLFLTQDGIEDPDEEPFEAQAEVMWTAEQDEGRHVAGFRFGKLSAPQAAQLKRFLAALGEQG